MRNIKEFFVGLLILFVPVGIFGQTDWVRYQPSPFPDRIMLTIPDNPSSSRAVTWRTSYDIKKSVGQIIEASDQPGFDSLALSVKGTNSEWEHGSFNAMGHKVVFTNLKPNTLYNYRVGDSSGYWSEWFQFKTASDKQDSFSFLYFGDVQNGIKDYASRIIRQAFMHQPDAAFMLFAGDLVNRSYEYFWAEFFYAGSFIFGTIPTLATPGNHEYYPNPDTTLAREFSKHWDQIFINPANGPKDNLNKSYYIDYQGARLISIDTYFLSSITVDEEDYMNWLESILNSNTNKWTIVFFHHPVYSCSYGRDNVKVRTLLKPIFKKYGVDLVLQGHDHSYCRGQNLSNLGDDCKNPPMYVVSVAGSKMYGLSMRKWADRVGSSLQLYQVINIKGDSITFNSYTTSGKIYDSFKIIKQKKKKNKVVEDLVYYNYEEQVNIPFRYMYKYAADSIKKYKEIYE